MILKSIGVLNREEFCLNLSELTLPSLKVASSMKNVLTGFKYIGEQIALLEEKHEENRFIFGFEESNGYLRGTEVRDKDAVLASMLFCEAASYYKNSENKNLQLKFS